MGYSLAFTPSNSPYLGTLERLFLEGLSFGKLQGTLSVSHIAPTIPESVFVVFQLTFAIITPALITGPPGTANPVVPSNIEFTTSIPCCTA